MVLLKISYCYVNQKSGVRVENRIGGSWGSVTSRKWTGTAKDFCAASAGYETWSAANSCSYCPILAGRHVTRLPTMDYIAGIVHFITTIFQITQQTKTTVLFCKKRYEIRRVYVPKNSGMEKRNRFVTGIGTSTTTRRDRSVVDGGDGALSRFSVASSSSSDYGPRGRSVR